MSDNIDRIKRELESLGYETCLSHSPLGEVVSFRYTVEAGAHEGKRVVLGISMQGNELYPEYAPHWIHLTPPINDDKGGSVQEYSDADGRQWVAMSRPPGEMWDQLPTKHMSAYLNEHLRRFWNNI